jgi:putative transposase
MSAPDRRAMLDRADKALSLRRQCALLGVARSDIYRLGKPVNDNDAALTRRIDELFTAWPWSTGAARHSLMRWPKAWASGRNSGIARLGK